MSCIIMKPALHICKNKGTDQLRGNHPADQSLCFCCYTDSTNPLLPKFEISSLKPFCVVVQPPTLVRYPEILFCSNAAYIYDHSQNIYYMSREVRKPDFCICENKDADQLRGNREADQRLCFRHLDSTIPLLSKSEISSL